MNRAHSFSVFIAALALVACAGCGTPLRLRADPADGGTHANTQPVLSADALKCHTGDITGARLSNCTCSTDNNQDCPVYANKANAGSQAWDCTTFSVSGGYAYSCECAMPGGANGSPSACGAFYNPANPNATQNGNQPVTTCQTVATSFGFQTTCTCVDTQTAPCDFYQGSSYATASAPYVEVCSSTLHATGATTVCTCNQLLQASGAACPATFVPTSKTVTDLIY